MSAIRVRAVAGLRARPAGAVVTALGLLFVGVMLGAAATTATSLASGFTRAQQAAGTADVIVRFQPVERKLLDSRIATLANVRRRSYRLVVRPVDLAARDARGRLRTGTAEVDGIEPGDERFGLAIVAGRALSGAPGEAVIERGLAEAWSLRPGDEIRLRGRRRSWEGRIVGISVEPDDVAFPLASRPRVYVPSATLVGTDGRRHSAGRVSAVYLQLGNRARLAETLTAARSQSFGLSGVTFVTRSGMRATVDQASGLVVRIVGAFALIALAAATAMLATEAHGRVARDLPTIGVLRVLGFGPLQIAATYALEAALAAVPAVTIGVIVGALVVRRGTDALVRGLNGLPASHLIGFWHAVAIGGAVLAAAAASALPAFGAARRPPVESLRGERVVRVRRGAVSSRPFLLGVRLAIARPGRLAGAVAALAIAISVVFLLLGVARFLLAAQRDPSLIGERYALVVAAPADRLADVLRTPGVAAAAPRLTVTGVDAFDLGQPLQIVAFGSGREGVFAGRPLLEGRRVRADGEAEVGRGLAQILGLAPGATLRAVLVDGRELRLRVVGVVQELSREGRVAYTTGATLADLDGAVEEAIAVRLEPGATAATVRDRLEQRGLRVSVNSGIAPVGGGFLHTAAVLLITVGIVNGIVCAALVLLGLTALARERARTIGIVRVAGGGGRDVAALLAGAAAAQLALAVPAGFLLSREVLGPALARFAERYGTLPVAPRAADVALIAAAAFGIAIGTATIAALRSTRRPIVSLGAESFSRA